MEEKNTRYIHIPVEIEDSRDDNKDVYADFKSVLRDHLIDDDLAQEIIEQLKETRNDEPHNVIFIFTEGKYAITGIHVPTESLDGRQGPILMMGAHGKHILAVFSRDDIVRRLSMIDAIENKTGLPGFAEQAWFSELEKLVEIIRIELQNNPPENWIERLGN